MEEIRNLSKQIDFNNLTYKDKGKTAPKHFIAFKGPLGFYKNIKEGYITLEKAEEKQKELNKVIKLFDDYSIIVSEAKHKSKNGEGLKILTPKQMLQRLTIALAQVKAGNTSENLLNEIRQIIYSLYRAKEITKKVYNNIMNSIKV